MDRQDLVTEMRDLRERVPGVTGALVAAFDGQLVAADLEPGAGPRADPDFLAGIAAASIGIARQVAGLAGQGTLGQAVTRASRGHVAVYAVGDLALLAVLGDDDLDVDDLRLESQPALDRIHAILAGQRNGA
jgi:predicted regulator of Ras-like GTPase activity (Roadblock/LC7/MglB family)